MKQQEKLERIQECLDKLYPTTPIPLHHHDAFTLSVAVALSAQTTDKKVNEITPQLFAVADTPEKMRKLSVEEIHTLIRHIGLANQKAKNLKRMSERLCSVFNGIVPDNFEDLESLAGVGHKTASVVMSQAFGHAAFPVDTHIHRLASRWGLSDGSNVVKTERDLKRLFPESTWNRLHLQIIFFGREHCPARYHEMANCLICAWAATKKRIAENDAVLPKTRKISQG